MAVPRVFSDVVNQYPNKKESLTVFEEKVCGYCLIATPQGLEHKTQDFCLNVNTSGNTRAAGHPKRVATSPTLIATVCLGATCIHHNVRLRHIHFNEFD
uniref:Zf-LSD1 domain-containing protein n=1 Tax=Echinococcus granulosus TaxID=6210 RepID=A0A068WY91_ECHGR|nr:hypothetical protein EgrG_002041400 [Echinococcus granulosus]